MGVWYVLYKQTLYIGFVNIAFYFIWWRIYLLLYILPGYTITVDIIYIFVYIIYYKVCWQTSTRQILWDGAGM